MNSLQAKIQEAATLFQTHQFKKSLQLYQQSISICKKNSQPKSLLHNLLSSKGALLNILGDQKGALQCLNQVLNQDPYHALCLMRRSQVLKKKNKLNKALKDLKLLEGFSPDNLQIAAMKIQVQNLKLKCKQVSSSSQSEQQSQKSNSSGDIDEEQKLNFSNLRQIDRKSVSIMFKPGNSRKSRVTIAGDIAIQYDAIQDDLKDDKSFASTNVSKQYAKQKYMKTFRQIQLDDQQQSKQGSLKQVQVPIIKVKPSNTGRTKSILKNRDSTLYINTDKKPVEKQKKYGGRQSKMIDLLRDIDGKVITGTHSQRSSQSIKEVQFRKSIFGSPAALNLGNLVQTKNSNTTSSSSNFKPKAARKSCLKRSSFEVPKQITVVNNPKQARRSKFDMLPKTGIDGIVIKNKRQSILSNKEGKQNVNNDANSSDSDQGSEHNIFGSGKIVISKEVRQNLGLGEDSGQIKKPSSNKPRAPGGKSILKKNSVLMKSNQNSRQSSPVKQVVVKKAKKSVMFHRTEQ